MTAHTNTLTLRMERILITRMYSKQGYVPCTWCEKPIIEGDKITYRSNRRTESRHYHYGCARKLCIV